MRKELFSLLFVNIAIVGITLYFTFDLITLAFDDTTQDAFRDYEINPERYKNDTSDNSFLTNSILRQPLLIPKIIHQTYKTEEIPEHWKEGQQRCIDMHPDYKYILWTDQMALDFIKEKYPWFLETFMNYKYPIERADAIRYFVLDHYGGVYIDLDDGCKRRLDPLLTAPAFLRKTSPSGVSNDVMGSVPGHPFFKKVIENLQKYDRNWFVPYITIMSSTGPLFISMIWQKYKWSYSSERSANGIIKILQPVDYKMHQNSFFTISKGSSWHLDDANFIKSLASHILACVVAGFIAAFSILYLEYFLYCWLCRRNRLHQCKTRFRNGDVELMLNKQSSSKFATPPMIRQLKKILNSFYKNSAFNKESNNIKIKHKKKIVPKSPRKDSNVSYS